MEGEASRVHAAQLLAEPLQLYLQHLGAALGQGALRGQQERAPRFSWLVGKDFRPRHPLGGACEQQAACARHNPAAHLGAADEDANAAGSPVLRRSAVQHGLPVRAPKPHVHLHRHGRVRVQDFSDDELCTATGACGAGGTRLSWGASPLGVGPAGANTSTVPVPRPYTAHLGRAYAAGEVDTCGAVLNVLDQLEQGQAQVVLLSLWPWQLHVHVQQPLLVQLRGLLLGGRQLLKLGCSADGRHE